MNGDDDLTSGPSPRVPDAVVDAVVGAHSRSSRPNQPARPRHRPPARSSAATNSEDSYTTITGLQPESNRHVRSWRPKCRHYEETTMHWHGMHLPAAGGGPHR